MSKATQTGHTPGLMDAGGGGGRGRPSFMARVHSFADRIVLIKSSCCCLQLAFLTGWGYKKIKPTYTNLDYISLHYNFLFSFAAGIWIYRKQDCEIWRGKVNLFFKSTKRGLENTVIKLTSHSSEGKHKITIRKQSNYKTLKEDLNVRLKVTFFQVNCQI